LNGDNLNTYIALFRGINVGGKNILPMKNLVNLLEDIGAKKVRTYIQSGKCREIAWRTIDGSQLENSMHN